MNGWGLASIWTAFLDSFDTHLVNAIADMDRVRVLLSTMMLGGMNGILGGNGGMRGIVAWTTRFASNAVRGQLIDATQWFRPPRKNLGKKNCELGEDDIERICDAFLAFKGSEQSKIFDNVALGCWKVTVERPLRIEGAGKRGHKAVEIKRLKEKGRRTEGAPPVIKRIHKRGTEPNPLHGLFEDTINSNPVVVEYEPDTTLRDTEQIPLQEKGGIDAFLKREVLPYAPDAWFRPDRVKIGYEISFYRHFYKPQPMRTLEEVRADILALERDTQGLLAEILGVAR